MMIRTSIVAMAIGAAFLTGCTDVEKQGLIKQNKELQARNDDLAAKNAELSSRAQTPTDSTQLSQLQNEIANRDQQIKDLQAQLRQPTPGAGAQPGIEGIETTYDAHAGTMTVDLPGDVLFSSGQDELKSSAKATLDKIASALKKDYAGKNVRVEGHSDTDPISKTKDKYVDNLDLSLNRAAAVTRYLESKGVSPKLITTSGFGPTHPKGNKAASRRVEIVVVVK